MQVKDLSVGTLFTTINGVSTDVFKYLGNNRAKHILFIHNGEWLPYETNFISPIKPNTEVRPVTIRVVGR